MTRTQIQLPDDVYDRARKVCKSREISLAELARRGLEYILAVYAPEPGAHGEWQPPKPRRLGWKGLTDAEIKEQAQLTATEAAEDVGRTMIEISGKRPEDLPAAEDIKQVHKKLKSSHRERPIHSLNANN